MGLSAARRSQIGPSIGVFEHRLDGFQPVHRLHRESISTFEKIDRGQWQRSCTGVTCGNRNIELVELAVRVRVRAKPFQRGINSIQLFYDGARW